MNRGGTLAQLADPEDSTITVYRANRAPKVFQRDDEITGEEVLPDFRLRVGEFFALPGDEEDQPT